jgi:hypothetical protein
LYIFFEMYPTVLRYFFEYQVAECQNFDRHFTEIWTKTIFSKCHLFDRPNGQQVIISKCHIFEQLWPMYVIV